MPRRMMYPFTVEGKGPFPTDMLRYDSCFPIDESAAMDLGMACDTRMRKAYGADHTYRIRLVGLVAPTVGRWRSFGWDVPSEGPPYDVS